MMMVMRVAISRSRPAATRRAALLAACQHTRSQRRHSPPPNPLDVCPQTPDRPEWPAKASQGRGCRLRQKNQKQRYQPSRTEQDGGWYGWLCATRNKPANGRSDLEQPLLDVCGGRSSDGSSLLSSQSVTVALGGHKGRLGVPALGLTLPIFDTVRSASQRQSGL